MGTRRGFAAPYCLLALPTGQNRAILLEFLGHHSMYALRQRLHLLKNSCPPQSVLHQRILILAVSAHEHIILDGHSKDRKILKGGGKQSPIGVKIVLSNIHPVDADHAGSRIVETKQQLDDGRFTRSVVSDQRCDLAPSN